MRFDLCKQALRVRTIQRAGEIAHYPWIGIHASEIVQVTWPPAPQYQSVCEQIQRECLQDPLLPETVSQTQACERQAGPKDLISFRVAFTSCMDASISSFLLETLSMLKPIGIRFALENSMSSLIPFMHR